MLQKYPMYAYLPASDLARARHFYEDTLGFTPTKETAGGVVYQFSDHTACFLYPTPNAGTSQASQAFWQVDDVEREVAELKSRGVALENYDMPGEKSPSGVFTGGGAKAAWFKDSEGNILAMVQSENKPLLRRLAALFSRNAPARALDLSRPRRLRPGAVVTTATGALALGAFAMGALALGALAIGRLAVGRARIGRLDIDDLRIGRVRGADTA